MRAWILGGRGGFWVRIGARVRVRPKVRVRVRVGMRVIGEGGDEGDR